MRETLPQGDEIFNWWRDGENHALFDHLREEGIQRKTQLQSQDSVIAGNTFSVLPVEGDEQKGEFDAETSENGYGRGAEREEDVPVWLQQAEAFNASDYSSVESEPSSIEDLLLDESWTAPWTDRCLAEIVESRHLVIFDLGTSTNLTTLGGQHRRQRSSYFSSPSCETS